MTIDDDDDDVKWKIVQPIERIFDVQQFFLKLSGHVTNSSDDGGSD